ncbi:MAG: ribosome silencing factor [Cyclobacteriaceae bacterium]
MDKKKRRENSDELSKMVVKGMQEKKANQVTLLNLKKVPNSIADYFVICTGTSDTHLDAIADSVEKEVKENQHQNPWHREGNQNKEWILLDYVDVVVHIFKKETRQFYNLENLWGDAELIEVDNGPNITSNNINM